MSAKVGGPESLHFEEVPARIESNLEVLGVGEDFGFQKTQETTQMWTANQKRMERFWRSLGRLTIGPGPSIFYIQVIAEEGLNHTTMETAGPIAKSMKAARS